MSQVSPAIKKVADAFGLKVNVNPFHASEGVELRQSQNCNYVCIGYIRGPQITEIYKRTIRKADVFVHDKLWLLSGLASMIRKPINDFTRLAVFNTSEFADSTFTKVVIDQLEQKAKPVDGEM